MSDEFKQASCAGKEAFTSPQDATKARRNQRNRRKATLETYRCQFCGSFHIGAPQSGAKRKARAGI